MGCNVPCRSDFQPWRAILKSARLGLPTWEFPTAVFMLKNRTLSAGAEAFLNAMRRGKAALRLTLSRGGERRPGICQIVSFTAAAPLSETRAVVVCQSSTVSPSLQSEQSGSARRSGAAFVAQLGHGLVDAVEDPILSYCTGKAETI